jgi:Ca2+ transporting ATPase
LRTNFRKGIVKDYKDHERRITNYGDNKPIVKEPKTLFEMAMEPFEDDMLRILCASACVSLVLGIATEGLAEGWLEGASILVAVVIIVTVTTGNDYIKQKQFEKLNAIATAKNVNCYRGGDLINMSVYDLLVGDVVEIETGEILSIDGILIEGANVSVDESSITGETN